MGESAVMGGISALGSLSGAMGGNSINTNIPTGQINQILDDSLSKGLDYSQGYTQKAVDQQNTSLTQALGQLNQGLQALQGGFNTSQALQTPYRDAGYNALDMYEDSLGVKRPTIGNKAVADALVKNQNVQNQLGSITSAQQAYNAKYGLGASTDPYQSVSAPTLAQLAKTMTPQQLAKYVKDNTVNNGYAPGPGQTQGVVYTGVGASPLSWSGKVVGSQYGETPEVFAQKSGLSGAIANTLAQPLLSGAQSQATGINTQQQNLNTYLQNQFLPQEQQIANAYNSGLFNPATVQNVGVKR